MQYILSGIKHGFRVGFNYSTSPLADSNRNMVSALEHPEVVDEYIAQEKDLHRMEVIPSALAPSIGCHISPFGVIPKKSKPGKWRLIVDLSSPHSLSVNDGVDKDICSLSYVSIDHIADSILSLGRGSLMAKVDIRQAYRNIPVHPDDRTLLGVRWKDELIIDKVLPFGLRSAPIIFTAVADALQWIMEERGVSNVSHYLDDYITLGPSNCSTCATNLAVIKQVCADTGTPIEEEKCECPATVLTFLGMELDTVRLEIRLPSNKLVRLRELLADWKGRKAGKKRDLLSLIGVLQHASKAVRQGRSFLRRLINLSMVVHNLESYVRLNLSARSDIRWWAEFASQWNGTSMLFNMQKSAPHIFVASDASGTWGCVAYVGNHWFQYQWPPYMQDCHISVKELIPVVMAAAVWGPSWVGKSVRFQSDIAAVVSVLNSGSSRDDSLMHLIRCLAFITARFNFVVSASHVRGVDNVLADALSRDKLDLFKSNVPQAQSDPTRIPTELVDLLIRSRPDWTSANWTEL